MIIHGDSLHELKQLEDESVDLLCTDPPYGYSFMGKSWDKTLPDIGIFRECLRVLKPGSFAFVMSAPRSDVCARMMLMLEDAGFEIGFTPIYWTYASGFPKAMNIGKVTEKRGKKALDGSYGGFQPKPAVEVIIVAMKPLSEKTYVDQALKNGKGITWMDDCRFPTTSNEHEQLQNNRMANRTIRAGDVAKGYGMKPQGLIGSEQKRGRFPANLLVSDDVLNDGNISTSNSGGGFKARGAFPIEHQPTSFNDSGSYSRFFSLDAWAQTLPFLAVPKASKSEKNAGTEHMPTKLTAGLPLRAEGGDRAGVGGDGSTTDRVVKMTNHHPTVKPLKLMSYLITLGSRPGDVVLDPFLGSGTTAIAAKELGREYVGIEREDEYVEIARARLKAARAPEPTLLAAE